MSAFLIKMIACAAMLADHVGLVFENELAAVHPTLPLILRCFGRLAFPLFAFGIGEGAAHTSSPKKYLTRVFVFALISQLPYMLMRGVNEPSFSVTLFGLEIGLYMGLSVMATLFFGLCICTAIQEGRHLGAAFALGFGYLIDALIGIDYGVFGILLVMGLYFARQSRPGRALAVILFAVCYYNPAIYAFFRHLINSSYAVDMGVIKPRLIKCACMCIPAVFLFLYNGSRGRNAKLFTYMFYPAHMLIVWLVWLARDLFTV